jgi:hypothetical protein
VIAGGRAKRRLQPLATKPAKEKIAGEDRITQNIIGKTDCC